jgi:hypothetical protein
MSSSDESDNEQNKSMSTEQLEIMEQKIASNPLDFTMHEKYITNCTDDFVRKRAARENMNRHLLISPFKWLEWISEEESIASSKEEIAYIRTLYQCALQDFHSPELYEQYIEFLLKYFQHLNFEPIFEEILLRVGNFFHGSQKIWTKYIELSTNRAKLYTRRLSIPHYELNETWQAYTEWETDPHQFKINEEICIRTQHLSSEKIHFETDLVNVESWLEYITKEKDHATRITLLERCLLVYYKNERIWLKYIELTNTSDLSVYKRAIRGCPQSSRLLIDCLNQLQFQKSVHQEIQDVYNRARHIVKFDIEVLKTYCVYMNFRLEGRENDQDLYNETYQVFEDAIQYISTYYSDSDPTWSLHRLWAHLVCFKYGNVDRAREIYEFLLSRCADEATIWYHYVTFERLLNSTDKLVIRRLFAAGLKQIKYTKSALTFGDAWLEYEREFGDITSLMDAKQAIATRKLEDPVEKVSRVSKKRESTGEDEISAKKKKHEDPEKIQEKTAPKKKSDIKEKPILQNDSLTVTVSNLPHNLIDSAIGNILKQVGCKVVFVRLVLDNGRFRGTAHVQMENDDSVNRALGMNDQKIHGRIITVVKFGEQVEQSQVMSNQDFRKFL